MSTLFWICAFIASCYGILWYYLKRTIWCRSQTCLVKKTAIVTGANTGIGYETALDFAKRGARVILACRNKEKAETAKRKIIEETNNTNIVVKLINLESFESVRAFAREINETEDRLDILVNNAGAGGSGNKKSFDGFIPLMQINYFSSFLLTNLFIPLLKKSAPSRIINVSSLAAKYAKFHLEELNIFTGIHNVYANSKLCNILFTIELAEKLKGSQVTTYSLHPGTVQTDIFRHFRGHYKTIVDFLKANFFKTSEEGAQTSIYVSVAKGIEELSGQHFDNCERVERYQSADVPGLAKKVWERTMALVELKPEEVLF